jgi:hypothetical protein
VNIARIEAVALSVRHWDKEGQNSEHDYDQADHE